MRCITLLLCLSLSLGFVVEQETSIKHNTGLCLGVGSDGATLQLLKCKETSSQEWKLQPQGSGYLIKNPSLEVCIDAVKSNNGGVAQVFKCDAANKNQVVDFSSSGSITFSSKCLSSYSHGDVGDMLIFKSTCSDKWTANGPLQKPKRPAVPTRPRVPPTEPVAPKRPPTTRVARKPAVQQESMGQTRVQSVTPQAVMYDTDNLVEPSPSDHYLCVCVTDEDEDACTEAVKMACVMGHIPEDDCMASFDEGDHEAISGHVLRIIKNGARCDKFDPSTLRKEEGTSAMAAPIEGWGVHDTPTEEDHYLCVCLASGGEPADEACQAAVQTACIVGHIPETACEMSIQDDNHVEVVDHVMRLIDQGANCQTRLDLSKLEKSHEPVPVAERMHTPSGTDHYLCVCLDDWRSQACYDAALRACYLGHIPHADCEVAKNSDYSRGVTQHMLRLVDHGVGCSAHGAMHFTNNRCHCMQSWRSKSGTLMQFPNNCGDPGGEKGYPWCATYPSEDCTGVGGEKTWDRCDQPKHPVRDISLKKHGEAGKVTEADHYLCVCLDKEVTTDVCRAAVEGACAVGHIPSDACRESFENHDHRAVSDHIVKLVEEGAKCKQALSTSTQATAPKETESAAIATTTSAVQSTTRDSLCAHGDDEEGKCKCYPGYAGTYCDECAAGFTGFPDCMQDRRCSPSCVHGTCDTIEGKCVCPTNYVGERCDVCASGMHGADCLPAEVVTHFDTASTVKQICLIILVISVAIFVLWYARKSYSSYRPSRKYSQIPADPEKGTTGPDAPFMNTGLAI